MTDVTTGDQTAGVPDNEKVLRIDGVVKRFVLLSALQPRDTLGNLGFRCARSQP